MTKESLPFLIPTPPPLESLEQGENTSKYSPTKGAFDPANQAVSGGCIQLNKVSPQHLNDISDSVVVEILVLPQGIENVYNRNIGTFWENTRDILNIGESHDFHYKGNPLTGAKVYENPIDNPKLITYEEDLAQNLRQVFEKANKTEQSITTQLFLGTDPIINKIHSNLHAINTAIENQGGKKIDTDEGRIMTYVQMTSTIVPSKLYEQGLENIWLGQDFSDQDNMNNDTFLGPTDRASARPVALIIPPKGEQLENCQGYSYPMPSMPQ